MANTLRKPLFLNSYGVPEETALNDMFQASAVTLTGDASGVALYANNTRITGVASPTGATDAVNKQYVDSYAQGIKPKGAVLALADAQVALTGLQTIDGVTLADSNRVLLTAQTDPKQNGIWLVHSGAWTRPTDFQAGYSVAGASCFVEKGTKYAEQGWVCTADDGSDTVDTSALAFTQFTGAGEITFAPNTGLSKNNNQIGLAFSNGIFYDGNGVAVKFDTTTTLADGTGLHVTGVPQNPLVGGAATQNFNATNVNTLLGGNYADNLHKHLVADHAGDTQNAIVGTITPTPAAGAPLYAAGSGMALADAAADASAMVIGVVAARAGFYVSSGVAKGVLTGATPGAMYYLAAGGGLTPTVPTASGNIVVRVGFAVSATDLVVMPQYLGKRS